MSKKTHWKFLSSTQPEKMMSKEEKEKFRQEKRKEREYLFKIGLAIDRLPTEKVNFKKKNK